MGRFGKVIFKRGGERGALLQRTLAERLKEKGVIDVDDETIQKWYEEDLKELAGSVHTYVLHNGEQADIFRSIMESPEMADPSVRWKVTSFCRDKEFIRWVEQTERNARQTSSLVKKGGGDDESGMSGNRKSGHADGVSDGSEKGRTAEGYFT